MADEIEAGMGALTVDNEAGMSPWPEAGATATSTEGEGLIWHERWGWGTTSEHETADIIEDQRAEIEALKAENEALKAEVEALKGERPAPVHDNYTRCSAPGCTTRLYGVFRTSGQGLCKGHTQPAQCTVDGCGKKLVGEFRTSGQGLCKSHQPARCTVDGCGKGLNLSWRFVGKCKEHGGGPLKDTE